MSYPDRSRGLRAFGWLLLPAGIAVGWLGPVEMYCFYLFAEGGRFHYAGFGFGSFMFGNIAAQIVGYYLIAVVLVTLGYGHVRLRRWVRPLTLAALGAWWVIGAPLIALALFIWLASKDLTWPVAAGGALAALASYTVIPALLVRFYQGRSVRATLADKGTGSAAWEDFPIPLLTLSALYGFFTVMLHLLILFNGIFPALGRFLFGLPGIVALDFTILSLLVLMWGTLRRHLWAWWGGLIGWGTFTFSTLLTFWRTDYATLLAGLAFPSREVEILDGLPLQGWHMALLFGLPLLLTWGLLLASKRHFGPGGQ